MNNNIVVALAGNPNVGKSTIFNKLTGLKQHTGNWPGKTVSQSIGHFVFNNNQFMVVDLPGTYSLMSNSPEEEIARDFICFEKPDVTVVVVDATCLERNLNLVLQTMEITSRIIICVNLMDEAKRKGIKIDLKELEKQLGVKVIGTSANKGFGIKDLKGAINNIVNNKNKLLNPFEHYDNNIREEIQKLKKTLNINNEWIILKLIEGNEDLNIKINNKFNLKLNYENINDLIMDSRNRIIKNNNNFNIQEILVEQIVKKSEFIFNKVVTSNKDYNKFDNTIDKYLTSKLFGIPIMILLFGIIFFITISGANVPSDILAKYLFKLGNYFSDFLKWISLPIWLNDMMIYGIYRTLAWVVSVMLPPMAIFFPLFTLLEDLGYLPRIAFNLDKLFKKAGTCGKQALTMCMGFGCNAAGVVGCRIINSPKERLIAIITNNFVPCNGRFPILIAVITMFFTNVFYKPIQPFMLTIILTLVIIFSIFITLTISKLLSTTFLKGIPSNFTLELPPYRKPQVKDIIIRSFIDRTLKVLGRAIIVAIPAGIVIWLMANINIYNASILTYCADFLNPLAQLIGMDGYILMAFILGFPANEIVIPIIIMSYMATGNITELNSLKELKILFVDNGWTWLTAISVMLFTLMHWPCGTTCLTIKKETQSLKWTIISILVPTITGIIICFVGINCLRLILAFFA